jgi:hypothetical protein
MISIKRFEGFSGKIKLSNLKELDTQDVIELIKILFSLKPSLPDILPNLKLSKLIENSVTYLSDDEMFNIEIKFSEVDTYVDDKGVLCDSEYKTIFKIKIYNNTNLSNASEFSISEVRDYIVCINDILEISYDSPRTLVRYQYNNIDTRLSISDFRNISTDMLVENITFIIKII